MFDIFSLANQLHRFNSTNSDTFESGKFYFSKNLVPDLLAQEKIALISNILLYNKSLNNPDLLAAIADYIAEKERELQVAELEEDNELVNEIFKQARKSVVIEVNL